MADFCRQCSVRVFGSDYGDLRGLCEADEVASTLCEGCGMCWVNSEGVCVDANCLKKHGVESPIESKKE